MESQRSTAVISNEAQINGLKRDSLGSGDSNDDALYKPTEFPSLSSVLDSLEEIRIHQHLDVLEVCLMWERNNRYSIYNKADDQILYTYEAAQCYARQCYGSLRELTLITTDNEDNRLLYLQRPLKCSSRCFYACCCLQQMTILLTPEETLGTVREKWTCCLPHYEIEDAEGNLKFSLYGGCCHCRCCCDIDFTVKNTSGCEVASINKHWGGCKSIIGASNDFTIEYFPGLSPEEKIMILGASFLLDFNYFERHGKCF